MILYLSMAMETMVREDMNTATQGRVFTILHMRSEREDMNTATQGRVFTTLHMRSERERTLPHKAQFQVKIML